jgi:hypothetical protein
MGETTGRPAGERRGLRALAAVVVGLAAFAALAAFGGVGGSLLALSPASAEYQYQTRLIVVKHVVNDSGGAATAAQFTMTVTAGGATPSTFPGAEAGTPVLLNPGAYSVSETGPGGYFALFSSACSGTIQLGETRTCTVVNDDEQPGKVTICHRTNSVTTPTVTMSVRQNAVDAHLRHGDVLGPC